MDGEDGGDSAAAQQLEYSEGGRGKGRDRASGAPERGALGSARIHLSLLTAWGIVCLACGRCLSGNDPVGLAAATPCNGWAPILTSAAAGALRSASALDALRVCPTGHPLLAAALRRGLGLALPEAAQLRPREPD